MSLNEIKKLEPQRLLLLYKLLQDYGVNETIVDDIIQSLDKHPGRVFETQGYRLVLDRERLIISGAKSYGPVEAVINAGDHEINFGNYKLHILHDDSPLIVKDNPFAVSIDSELLKFPLTVRSWQQGDVFFTRWE